MGPAAISSSPLIAGWAGFGRWGWDEGQHESYAYTEVDQTVEIGAGGNGKRWIENSIAPVWFLFRNGISRDHQHT